MKIQSKYSRKLKNDILVISFLFALAFIYLSSIDAVESLLEFVERHETMRLDDLLILATLFGLAGIVFAARRYRETQSELRKRRVAEANVRWLAHHDSLTDLPNRHMLDEFVREFDLSEAPNGKDAQYAVYSIDLDGFKKVNDLHGHAAGDQLLKTVAQRLTLLFPDDLVVRLGGDEFVVVAQAHRDADVIMVANNIVNELTTPINIDHTQAEIGASIGVVIFPAQVDTLEEAIRCADITMYSAKKMASTQVTLFRTDIRDEARQKAELEMQFRAALSADAIEPYYQPLVDLRTNEIYGFEVLARWILPNGDPVMPSVFIPLAEEAGLISKMSEQLLRKACRDAMNWPAHILLSFNLSPTQLSDRLIGLRIINVLNEVGFLPTRLEIEITENAMILDSDSALFVLEGLQTLGIRIALDDFGTGYSGLSQMAKFKFNRLKIDHSFIRDFEHDKKQNSIIMAIIALGKEMNLAITAEGIEQQSQLEALKLLGCNSGQGYLLGRPMTAEMAAAALGGAGTIPLFRQKTA